MRSATQLGERSFESVPISAVLPNSQKQALLDEQIPSRYQDVRIYTLVRRPSVGDLLLQGPGNCRAMASDHS
jgi:hypothetical protein